MGKKKRGGHISPSMAKANAPLTTQTLIDGVPDITAFIDGYIGANIEEDAAKTAIAEQAGLESMQRIRRCRLRPSPRATGDKRRQKPDFARQFKSRYD